MTVKVVLNASRPAKVQAAPLESLHYIRQMIVEMRSQAAEVDWQLTYLLEMAASHAVDLLSGERKPEKTMPR